MITITPAEVPALLPGAPVPQDVFIGHAALWVQQQLDEWRVTEVDLNAAQVSVAQTALAATALAYQSDLRLAQHLLTTGLAAPKREIETVKVTGEVEVKFRAPGNATQTQADTVTHWTNLALHYLKLALPARPRRATFFGAAR